MLEDILRPISNRIQQAMENLENNSTPEMQREMEEVRRQLGQKVLLDVMEVRRLYGKLANQYYEKQVQNQKLFKTQSFEDDVDQYIELVGHSTFSGNHDLLDRWGIDYPINNPNVLAEPIAEYIEHFDRDILDNWERFEEQHNWSSETKFYWVYLIKTLSSRAGLSTAVETP